MTDHWPLCIYLCMANSSGKNIY